MLCTKLSVLWYGMVRYICYVLRVIIPLVMTNVMSVGRVRSAIFMVSAILRSRFGLVRSRIRSQLSFHLLLDKLVKWEYNHNIVVDESHSAMAIYVRLHIRTTAMLITLKCACALQFSHYELQIYCQQDVFIGHI